jgi:hypothetical protein
VRDEQRGEAGHHQPPNDVRAEHHEPTVGTVADRFSDEQERDRRHGHRYPEHGRRGGRVPQRVGGPHARDQEDAVADERDGLPGPEPPKVARTQRAQEVDAGEAAGAVERLEVSGHH